LRSAIQNQSKEHNFKKELLTGVATSTVYTLFVLMLVHFKVLDITALIPPEEFFNPHGVTMKLQSRLNQTHRF